MPRIKKTKTNEEIKEPKKSTKKAASVKNIDVENTPKVEEPVHVEKEYVVALGTPSFYVIQLEDGSMKTIQGSNTYRRGDIVKL